ncbi:DNA repair protein XRCC3 homolog [Selaginella moellendorffii]|uniref:DNA repair protein XRCC3 homolog n=1 Tax=Selaginella moellendorffii TaxID=88036 RepID=UPI000D1CE664|nr:DNA repair protein XRCC3 homolog [Selaginella moellendorffii]|eukprot:XP_024515864.1 DNA repair protein XRCC3 homolog [Selaginella moellendorffii]
MTPTKIEPRVNGFHPSKNVFVEPAESIQQLFTYFERLERVLNQQQRRERPVRLLLIDSVAASFRSNRTEMVIRSRSLFQLSAKLKKLAHDYDVAVLVTNQVMDCVDGSKGIQIGNLLELVSSGRRIAPALGLSWAHCINTRLFLSRRDELSSEKLIEAPVKRRKVVNDEGMKQATASINEFQPECVRNAATESC